ncbi:MarR family transcriptional regulator [bacterium 1XD21-13]|nr:MarR family transcriptional regulator [bacterium 1XD21-13]
METGTYISHVNHFRKFYDLAFKEQARAYGFQMIDVHILLFLKNNPSLNTARDIVISRGLSKSNVSNALEKLRGRGMIRLGEDTESRRIQRIFLEPAGEEAALELKKTQDWCFAQMLAGFSQEEREYMNRIFKRIDTNVSAALKALERSS